MKKRLLPLLFLICTVLPALAQVPGKELPKNTVMDPNDLLKILIAPLIAALIQWWTSKKSKARLKIDIELLELYKKIDDTSKLMLRQSHCRALAELIFHGG